jgi:nucleoside-diphosphate-sugar epimerase
MSKRKLLICGATGFIGRNLAEHFAQRDEFEVVGTYLNSEPPDIPGVKMLRADLTDKSVVDDVINGMDVIVQAAATTSGAKEIITKPYYHVTDNAVMNSLIFRAAYEHSVSHVVYFSCSVMYQPSEKPLKETDFNANQPLFPSYFGVGWTKVYIEKMCEFYSNLKRTKYTAVRHSNIYGPYDKYDLERSHVFGATMTKVMTATDGKILVWGSGEEERDLLYVSDLVDFVSLAIEKQESPFELLNVGYGEAVSIKELVKKIIAASGNDLKMEHDLSKPTIKTSLCLDTTKAQELLGWQRRVSLEDGIQKTMKWYRENML